MAKPSIVEPGLTTEVATYKTISTTAAIFKAMEQYRCRNMRYYLVNVDCVTDVECWWEDFVRLPAAKLPQCVDRFVCADHCLNKTLTDIAVAFPCGMRN